MVDQSLIRVDELPETDKRDLAIRILRQLSSRAILEILREVKPRDVEGYDYEDAGPITDDELIASADAAFLIYDQEEDANAQRSTR